MKKSQHKYSLHVKGAGVVAVDMTEELAKEIAEVYRVKGGIVEIIKQAKQSRKKRKSRK